MKQQATEEQTPAVEAKLGHVVVWTQEDKDRLDKVITQLLEDTNDDV
jgi:hypothetical protein